MWMETIAGGEMPKGWDLLAARGGIHCDVGVCLGDISHWDASGDENRGVISNGWEGLSALSCAGFVVN